MKNTIRWDNLTWTEIRELAEKDAVVLIPIGSTEQHGPHLPVGCDSIIATHISECACRKLNDSGVSAVVAPTMTVCNSMHHMSFPGSMSLSPTCFMQMLEEWCTCISSHGFKKIALINGHGGNSAPIQVALIGINNKLGFHVYCVNYYEYPDMERINAGILTTQSGLIHACEGETSIMLAIDGSLVDPIYRETSGGESYGLWARDGGYAKTFSRMEEVTSNGVEGNSYAATAEKGAALIEVASENICRVLSEDGLWDKQEVGNEV